MLVGGSRVLYRTIGYGEFHCERCGGDRPYRHRSGRRWAHLLGIPIVSLADAGEHLNCTACRTSYRVELLAVPTMAQMQQALLAGTKAAVLTLLRSGPGSRPEARQRGVEVITRAGAPEYDETSLMADLAGPGLASAPAGLVPPGNRPAIEAFAVQLDPHAKEWFLAQIVNVGLAGGSLGTAQREAIHTVARYLGMSRSRARHVISVTEAAGQIG
jgi:hypothetical protein